MKRSARTRFQAATGWILAAWLAAECVEPAAAETLTEQNERLFQELREAHALSDPALDTIREIFAASGYASQGNPAITQHPSTPQQCRERLAREGIDYDDPNQRSTCGARFMAPLYDPRESTAEQATVCIDRFEFPNIPCAYPVVWVRASEAVQICNAMGKRLCDAHEWEGACQGRLEPPDYRFDLVVPGNASASVGRMQTAHNAARSPEKRWSYGPEYRAGACAAASFKSPGCEGGSWRHCGSNTYPAGSFPDCRSPLGVHDLNGNAAEHMNLPLAESQMASRGSQSYGVTEMKGSWFIFDHYRAHPDWCRWRAPYWHGGRVMAADSHRNYHLGFRCCKTLEPRAER